jgi:hypothetical protein
MLYIGVHVQGLIIYKLKQALYIWSSLLNQPLLIVGAKYGRCWQNRHSSRSDVRVLFLLQGERCQPSALRSKRPSTGAMPWLPQSRTGTRTIPHSSNSANKRFWVLQEGARGDGVERTPGLSYERRQAGLLVVKDTVPPIQLQALRPAFLRSICVVNKIYLICKVYDKCFTCYKEKYPVLSHACGLLGLVGPHPSICSMRDSNWTKFGGVGYIRSGSKSLELDREPDMSDLDIVQWLWNLIGDRICPRGRIYPTGVSYVQPRKVAMTLEHDGELDISDVSNRSNLGPMPRLWSPLEMFDQVGYIWRSTFFVKGKIWNFEHFNIFINDFVVSLFIVWHT